MVFIASHSIPVRGERGSLMVSEFVFDKTFASLKEVLTEVERMIPFQEHPLAPFNRCESLEDIEFELRDFRYFST